MLRELLERDRGWKLSPATALLAAVAWPFVSTEPAANPMLFGALCFAFLLFGRFHQRATVFEAGLPIPGRRIVAARLLAVAAVLWPPALLVMGETLVLRGWRDAIPLLELAAAASLVVLVVQSNRIRETTLPPWPGYVVAVCVGFPLILVPGLLSHWGAVLGVCVAGSAALLARLWFKVPDGFQIAPSGAARARRFAVRCPAWCRVRLPVRWPAWRLFFNSVFNWRVWWDLILLYWLFVTGMSLVVGARLVISALSVCDRLEWLLVLPVSRRRLLLMMVLPWLSALIALLWLNSFVRFDTKAPAVSTGYSDVWQEKKPAGSGTPNVLVPASFWRWAWGWKAPVIQSPWGEKTEPRTFIRLGFAFYNPYSVAPDNSARFLEWQFARASEAVCGRGIPITHRIRTRSIEALVATLVFLGMFHLMFWAKTTGRRGRWWLILLCVLVPFFCDFFTTDRVIRDGPLSEVITLRLAAILPQNPAALVALAVLLLGGLYWAVEQQFEKVDLIPDLKPAKGER
jgi:hypothetical protein